MATAFIRALLFVVLFLSALWVLVLLWVHLGRSPVSKWAATLSVASLSTVVLIGYTTRFTHYKRWLVGYVVCWVGVATWFVLLPAKQDRAWKAEVEHLLSFTLDESHPNLVTLHHVRDFDWGRPAGAAPLVQPKDPYFYAIGQDDNEELIKTARWTNRTIDLQELSGVDIINSYWMGHPVGHTLLSFRFKNERPLSFSFEIRKKEHESFSAIGGFFRQFEMILIAAEERDIIYTRSNVRGEQVYIFPIEGVTPAQTRQLFMEYLKVAANLEQEPEWYNTLVHNCTTMIYDMARQVGGDQVPWDYRILASGYVPEYLYDNGLLPDSTNQTEKSSDWANNQLSGTGTSEDKIITQWRIEDWYQRAHINPKVVQFSFADNQGIKSPYFDSQSLDLKALDKDSRYRYSKLIRTGLPHSNSAD